LLAAARSLMMSRIGLRVSLDMESAVMMRIMNLPARFFREHSSGELSSRYGAIGRLCGLLLDQVFATGLGAVLSLLYIGQISHYAPGLAVYALLIILAGVLVSVFSGLAQIRVSREVMERSSREAGLSFSLINAVQKIRLAGAEKRAFARWAHAYADVAELTYNPPMLIRLSSVITGSISLAGTILLFYMAVRTGVSPSEYIAFNAAYGAVTAAFSALTGVALSAAGIGPVLDVAKPILETEPEVSENRSMVTELSGSIELSNVWFRYTPNMPWVVNGMNLKIKAGEYVALVGTTGCGKSTLVRLLLGFETPDRGAVYYNGKDIRTLDVHSLRRRIGTVTQDGSLFQGSIFQNISISSPRMTLQDAWEAAEMAGLADDIRRMPMGMQTQISEGAGGISGGQKQRIMIARALAPKPQILIFDEATSALDNRTQQLVSEALDGLHCTRIVIAHRLSTIRNCSRILVLDQGRILEEGTYDELVAKKGFFAELIERQRLDVKTK
ncbi:MAG: ATP-binding cassette domain-containing protein, partial [Clostridium sp.]|nr:ATP-binding cassette domain-containing protein [Clostridium sp.]